MLPALSVPALWLQALSLPVLSLPPFLLSALSLPTFSLPASFFALPVSFFQMCVMTYSYVSSLMHIDARTHAYGKRDSWFVCYNLLVSVDGGEVEASCPSLVPLCKLIDLEPRFGGPLAVPMYVLCVVSMPWLTRMSDSSNSGELEGPLPVPVPGQRSGRNIFSTSKVFACVWVARHSGDSLLYILFSFIYSFLICHITSMTASCVTYLPTISKSLAPYTLWIQPSVLDAGIPNPKRTASQSSQSGKDGL